MDARRSENDIHRNIDLDDMFNVDQDNKELLAYPLIDELVVKNLLARNQITKRLRF